MDFLKQIQKKSSETKTQYAFVTAGIITSLIAIVWVSTLPASFSKVVSDDTVLDNESKSLTDLFSETKSQLGNIIEGTTDSIESVEDTMNMDALNMNELEAGQGQPNLPEDKLPLGANQESLLKDTKATTTQEIKNTPTSPRVILIATTTSKKIE